MQIWWRQRILKEKKAHFLFMHIAQKRWCLGNLSTRGSWFTNGIAGRGFSVENAFQGFALSSVSFLQRKHDFRGRICTFVWRILFEEPRIWTSGFNLKTRVFKSVTAAQERLDMRSGCHAAKILPVGVRGTKKDWCLSSLLYLIKPPPY